MILVDLINLKGRDVWSPSNNQVNQVDWSRGLCSLEGGEADGWRKSARSPRLTLLIFVSSGFL